MSPDAVAANITLLHNSIKALRDRLASVEYDREQCQDAIAQVTESINQLREELRQLVARLPQKKESP